MPPQLSRLIIIFGFLIAAFIAVRWAAKPDSFYQYGHYRGKALTELASRPARYVPRTACADCHDEEAAQNHAGPHAAISCQSCHGPGDAHIADPSTENITKPVVLTICTRCHLANKERPASFPQIETPDHNGGASCETCHTVHNPHDIHEG